jgi:hypothetical protein
LGTFHQGLSDLHGITVVVDTAGPRLYVGRCHEADARSVILHDVDVFDETSGVSKAAYLERAAAWGVFKKHDVLVVPASEVTSIRRLGEL